MWLRRAQADAARGSRTGSSVAGSTSRKTARVDTVFRWTTNRQLPAAILFRNRRERKLRRREHKSLDGILAAGRFDPGRSIPTAPSVTPPGPRAAKIG